MAKRMIRDRLAPARAKVELMLSHARTFKERGDCRSALMYTLAAREALGDFRCLAVALGGSDLAKIRRYGQFSLRIWRDTQNLAESCMNR